MLAERFTVTEPIGFGEYGDPKVPMDAIFRGMFDTRAEAEAVAAHHAGAYITHCSLWVPDAAVEDGE